MKKYQLRQSTTVDKNCVKVGSIVDKYHSHTVIPFEDYFLVFGGDNIGSILVFVRIYVEL